MKLLSASIVGLIAGLIGASVWITIAYFARVEVGWIAWLIGGVVGFAVALGARGECSVDTGLIAVVISLVAIGAGKFVAVTLNTSLDYADLQQPIVVDDFAAMQSLQQELAREHAAQGKSLAWADVQNRWSALTPTEQAAYRHRVQAGYRAELATFTRAVSRGGFLGSFGLMDVAFIGLAVITAFRLGTGLDRSPESHYT